MIRQPPVVVAALLVLLSVAQGDPFFGESPGHLPPQPRTLQSAGDPSTSAGTVDEAAYEGEQVAFGVVASLCILLGCGMTVFVCISASRPAPAPTSINGQWREDADYDNFARDPNGRLVCILDVNAPPTVVWGPGARHKGAAAATGGPGPGSPSPPLEPAWWRRRGGGGFKGIAGGGGVLSGQAGPAASPVGTAGNPSAANNRSNVPVVVGNPMQRAMQAHGVPAPASPPAAIVPSMPSLFAIDDAGGAAWGPPSAFPAAAAVVIGDGGGIFPVLASAPLLHPEPLPLPTSADQRHHFHPVPTTGVLAAQQQQQQQPLSIYSGEGVVEGLLSPSGEAPAPEIGIPQHPPAAIVVGAAHVVMNAPPPDARDDDPRLVPLLSTVYSPGPGPSTTATSTTTTTTHNPLPDTHSPPHLPMPPSARRVVGGGANVTAAVRVLAQRAAPMTDLEAALLVQRVYKGHKLRSLLRGWVKVVDDDGDVFFHNPRTGDVLWDLPRLPFMPVRPLGAPAAGSGAAAGRAPALSSATAAALGLLALLPAGAAEGGSVAPGSAGPPSRSRTPAGLPFDPHTDDDGRPLAGGWIRYTDGTGDVWYVQLATHETSWEPVYPPQQ
jgi:hypothetical protein